MHYTLSLRTTYRTYSRPQFPYSRNHLFGNIFQLLVVIDMGENMGRGLDLFVDSFQDFKIWFIRIKSSNPLPRLERIGHVGNHYPVAVAQHR